MIKLDTTTEAIESKGGLTLIGMIAEKAGLGKIKSSFVKKAGDIILSLFGLMAEGKTDFENMGEKRGSVFFKEALNLDFVYAKETVRLYLVKMAKEADSIIKQLRESAVKIIRKAPLHGIWIEKKQYIPIDVDTSTMDNSKTKKEGVSRTYQGYDGFHPIFAYIGKEGYMLDCELRPGSQHCQNGTVEFLRRVKEKVKSVKPGARVLFRLDSGNDAFETLKELTSQKGHYCIVKRNKRQENDEEWLKTAQRHGSRIESRKGKEVWVGEVQLHPSKKKETLENVKCVFEIIERKTDAKGNRLLIPEIEVNSWWTNLKCDAEKVIELYHDHATSEQFHGELKHDMGVERLPSGKMAVNKIVLAVAMNAFNALKLLGQKSLETEERKKFKRKSIRKVILDLICVAGKIVKHGRELILKIYEKDPVLPVFKQLYAALVCL